LRFGADRVPVAQGAARIWRIAPGSVDAVCDPVQPSGGCTRVTTGFSSVIDLTFGPYGTMYVLELAKNGLAGARVLGTSAWLANREAGSRLARSTRARSGNVEKRETRPSRPGAGCADLRGG